MVLGSCGGSPRGGGRERGLQPVQETEPLQELEPVQERGPVQEVELGLMVVSAVFDSLEWGIRLCSRIRPYCAPSLDEHDCRASRRLRRCHPDAHGVVAGG